MHHPRNVDVVDEFSLSFDQAQRTSTGATGPHMCPLTGERFVAGIGGCVGHVSGGSAQDVKPVKITAEHRSIGLERRMALTVQERCSAG